MAPASYAPDRSGSARMDSDQASSSRVTCATTTYEGDRSCSVGFASLQVGGAPAGAPQAQANRFERHTAGDSHLKYGGVLGAPSAKLTFVKCSQVEAARLNLMLPKGVRLFNFAEWRPRDSDNFGVPSDAEGDIEVGHARTSRQLQLAENRRRQTYQEERERFRRLGAADPNSLKRKVPGRLEVYSQTSCTDQTKSARSPALAEACPSVIPQPRIPQRERQNRHEPLAKMAPVDDQATEGSLNEPAFLRCQELIHRLYKKAYELKTLQNEFLQLTLDFTQQSFVSVDEVASKVESLIHTAISEGAQPAYDLLEYANGQMMKLAIFCENRKQPLRAPPKAKTTCKKQESQQPADRAKEQTQAPKAAAPQKSGPPSKASKKEAAKALPESQLPSSGAANASGSGEARIVVPSPPAELSMEQKQFIAAYIGRMTPDQQRGMIELVQNAVTRSGEGHQDSGAFEFTLESLPFEVGLKLHEYVHTAVKPILKAERKKAQDKKRWEARKKAMKEKREQESAAKEAVRQQ